MNGPRLYNIQILRAVAALMVVVHHVSDALKRDGLNWFVHSLGSLDQVGAAGVDLFFVISGFIMVHVGGSGFQGTREAIGFLRRRFLRIYPAYWIVTGVAISIWAAGVGFRSQQVDVVYLVKSLLCFPMFRHPLVDQGWTLSFELYFYVLFALGMFLLKSPGRFVITAGAWFFLSWLAGQATGIALITRFLGNPMLFEFLAGAVVGILHRRGRIPTRPLLGAVALVLAIVVLGTGAAMGVDWRWRTVVWGGPATLVLVASLSLPQVRGDRGNPLLVMGDASYSIYLVHGFATMALPRLTALIPAHRMIGEIIGVGLCIAAALGGWSFWKFVEKPVQAVVSGQDPARIGREPRRAS